jgi:hypothetical protein
VSAGAVFAGAEPAVGSAWVAGWAAFPAEVTPLVEAVRLVAVALPTGVASVAAVALLADVASVAGVEPLAACTVVVGAGGWTDLPGAEAWSTAAAAPVTALSAEPATELAAPVTEPTALVSGLSALEVPADPADAEPVTAEPADVTAEVTWGCPSCAAAWACLEKINSRKKIPAATIANCTARTAERFASSCGIDSSYPRGTSPYTAGATKAPDKPCTADEDEAFCTATTVHHSSVARQAICREAHARKTWLARYDQNDLR